MAAWPGRLVNASDGCTGPLWASATPPAARSSVSLSASVTVGGPLEGAAKGIHPSPPTGELDKLGALLPPPPNSDEDSWQSRERRGWRNGGQASQASARHLPLRAVCTTTCPAVVTGRPPRPTSLTRQRVVVPLFSGCLAFRGMVKTLDLGQMDQGLFLGSASCFL